MMVAVKTYQQRPVHMAQGRPVKSALLRKKLPTFNVPANGEEYLKQQQQAAEDSPEEIERRRAAAAPKVGPKSPFEEKVDAVLTCVGSQNSLREPLYKILAFCEDERGFSEVEAFVQQTPEYRYNHLLQTPYEMIHMLLKEQGLEGRAFDVEGNLLEGEDYEGFTSKDMQHAAEEYRVQTTEAGQEVCELMAPRRRFESLVMQHPHRKDTYRQFMEFCRTPRKLPEIEAFYKETPGLAHDVVQIHHTLSADFYVDKLEKAGVLVWIGAWTLSDEGKQILESLGEEALEE